MRSFASRASVAAASSCPGPLERRVRLRHEPADRHRAADVAGAGDVATGLDHLRRELGDLQHVLIGLRRQPAHEVELDLAPAGAVRGRDGPDQVLFADHLVDHAPQALGATLGREREAGPPAVARQFVGKRDVERIDACGRERQRGLRALVPIGESLRDVPDLAVVGGRQREQTDLLETGGLQASLDHVADPGDRPLADRPGDHAGLAEPAAAGAAAKDFDRHPLVHRLRERDEWMLRVRPVVEVHHRVLADPPRHAGSIRARPAGSDRPGGSPRRRTPARRPRRWPRGGAAPPRARRVGPPPSSPDDLADREHDLLAVAEDGRVDEVGDRLRIERGMSAGDHQRIVIGAMRASSGMPARSSAVSMFV